MPTFVRKPLRQEVGVVRMRECTLGTTQMAIASGAAVAVMDPYAANLDFSGQNAYQRAWLRVASVDYRVGSFNFQSGAWVSAQTAKVAIASGADFEVHERLSATELDRCIDEVLKEIRVQQEVAVNTLPGSRYYGIDTAASPHTVVDVANMYFFADPSNGTNRDRRDLSQFEIVNTGSGRELRLPTALDGSQQIILDALLELTLGADDAATLNLLNSDWVSWGAASQAYNMVIQRSPGQETQLLEKRRAEAARMFTKLAGRRQATRARKLSFDAPLSGEGRVNPNVFMDTFPL